MALTLEQDLYGRLQTDAAVTDIFTDRTYWNSVPHAETPLPWAYLAVTQQQPVNGTAQRQLCQSTVTVDIFAGTYAAMRDSADVVRTSLNGFSGGQIIRCLWADTATELTGDDGFHAVVSFTVTHDANAVIAVSSGMPRVEVRSDGLYVGGVRISNDPPDLTNYARKDINNTFTGIQTLTGDAGFSTTVRSSAIQQTAATGASTQVGPGHASFNNDTEGKATVVDFTGVTTSGDVIADGVFQGDGSGLTNLPLSAYARKDAENTFTALQKVQAADAQTVLLGNVVSITNGAGTASAQYGWGDMIIGNETTATTIEAGGVYTPAVFADKVSVGTATTTPPKVDIVTGSGDGTVNEANCLRLRSGTTDGYAQTLHIGVKTGGYGGNNNGASYLQSTFWGAGYDNPLLLQPQGGGVGIGVGSIGDEKLLVTERIAVKQPGTTVGQYAAVNLCGAYGVPMASVRGVYDGAAWYNGMGVTISTCRGPDVASGPVVERLRIAGDGAVTITSGFGIGTAGEIKTNQCVLVGTGDTLTDQTHALKVYDQSGTLVGYVPVFATITPP